MSMQTRYTIPRLTTGKVYRLRYRVLNSVNWSSFSPILNALVASAPSAPAAPRLISATTTSITLGFSESLFNGGATSVDYELWMDNGYGTPFTKVVGYTDNSMTYTISSGLVAGRIYTFKYRCQNSVDYSEFSTEARFAVAMPPNKPNAPTKDMSLSTETSIYIRWD